MSATAATTRRTRAVARPSARRPSRRIRVLGSLAVALVVATILAAGSGAFAVAPGQVVTALVRATGSDVGQPLDATAHAVLWQVRFPRVVLAVLVGGSLGVSGSLMQGVFRNPLAEPGIVGVSAGAAVGAVVSIVIGWTAAGGLGLTAAAFAGGLLATAIVYRVSRAGGRTEVVTLVLSGIAVNAIAGAIIGLAMFVSDDAALRSITFWNLGSLGASTWRAVATVAPVAAVGLVVAPRVARSLDLLALGEVPARHLGVDVLRLRRIAIVVTALLASASVAVAGVITFVGLVVPHLLRMVIGPGHRLLVPASAIGGALLLVLADLVARTVAAPAEVPLGVLTGLLGGPFFFWLVLRARARQGGWA